MWSNQSKELLSNIIISNIELFDIVFFMSLSFLFFIIYTIFILEPLPKLELGLSSIPRKRFNQLIYNGIGGNSWSWYQHFWYYDQRPVLDDITIFLVLLVGIEPTLSQDVNLVLYRWAKGAYFLFFKWSRMSESNRPPPDYKTGILPMS